MRFKALMLMSVLLAATAAQARDGDRDPAGDGGQRWDGREQVLGARSDRGREEDGAGFADVRRGDDGRDRGDHERGRDSDRGRDDWQGRGYGHHEHGRGAWHSDRRGRRFFDPPGFYLGLATGGLLFNDGFGRRDYRNDGYRGDGYGYSGDGFSDDGYSGYGYSGDGYGSDRCRVVHHTRYDRFGRGYVVRETQCWDSRTRAWCPTREW